MLGRLLPLLCAAVLLGCQTPAQAPRVLDSIDESCTEGGTTVRTILARATLPPRPIGYPDKGQKDAGADTGADACMTLRVVPAGAIRCLAAGGPTAPQAQLPEPGPMEMDVDVQVSTDDGRFAETMKGTLRLTGLIELRAEEPIGALKGSFAPTFQTGERGLEIDASVQGQWEGRLAETSTENGSKRVHILATLPPLLGDNPCVRAQPVAR